MNSESGENKPPFFIGNFFTYQSFDLSSESIGQSIVTLGQLIDTEGDKFEVEFSGAATKDLFDPSFD